jgi:hypothetical protein
VGLAHLAKKVDVQPHYSHSSQHIIAKGLEEQEFFGLQGNNHK